MMIQVMALAICLQMVSDGAGLPHCQVLIFMAVAGVLVVSLNWMSSSPWKMLC